MAIENQNIRTLRIGYSADRSCIECGLSKEQHRTYSYQIKVSEWLDGRPLGGGHFEFWLCTPCFVRLIPDDARKGMYRLFYSEDPPDAS
jgi:hypothetical protein